MKFYIRTFGCKVNLVDSAQTALSLMRVGHVQVPQESDADTVIVNSCAVTAEADRQSRKAVRQAQRAGKHVVVIGCAPKVASEAWKTMAGKGDTPCIEVLTSDEDVRIRLGWLDARCADNTKVWSASDRTRLPIVIQHGCDNSCAFCAARLARGRHRSVPLAHILQQVAERIDAGLSEVVLAGINLAAWGCVTTTEPSGSLLSELIAAILRETDVRRLRISSLGPEYLTDRFFEVFSDDRVCEHLHLSVQSGSPSVLKRMRRGHGVQEVVQAAREARKARPHVAITGDFIVGFPGETEDDFLQTVELAQRLKFAQLHVFPFSARDGTDAFTMSAHVSAPEKKARAARLLDLGRSLRADFLRSQHGRKVSAVVLRDGTAITSNNIRLRSAEGQGGSMVEIVVDIGNVVER